VASIAPHMEESQRAVARSPLADQALQRAPKELLVALGPGADAIDEQASLGHGGDKAEMAGACGGAPRQVAAS
jgi:hypothetical protein